MVLPGCERNNLYAYENPLGCDAEAPLSFSEVRSCEEKTSLEAASIALPNCTKDEMRKAARAAELLAKRYEETGEKRLYPSYLSYSAAQFLSGGNEARADRLLDEYFRSAFSVPRGGMTLGDAAMTQSKAALLRNKNEKALERFCFAGFLNERVFDTDWQKQYGLVTAEEAGASESICEPYYNRFSSLMRISPDGIVTGVRQPLFQH